MTENTDRIDNAIDGLRRSIGQNIHPYLLSAMLVNDEDRKQIIAGVMNSMIECMGRFLGSMEFQGVLIEGTSLDEAVNRHRNAHVLALTEREKEIRDAAGVRSDT